MTHGMNSVEVSPARHSDRHWHRSQASCTISVTRRRAGVAWPLWLMLFTVLAACAGGQQALAPLPAGGHHVLFIGNSLTYVNDLPATLSALAAASGDTIRVSSVAFPDYALEDHLAEGSAAKAIALGGWELVVLQQGPSSVEANRQGRPGGRAR